MKHAKLVLALLLCGTLLAGLAAPAFADADAFTVTLAPNGGSVNPTTVTQAAGTTYTLPEPTRSGHRFIGWTLSGGGSLSGNIYTFGTSNGTVTAQWAVIIPTYFATIVNGIGDGNFSEGVTVTITANVAYSGEVFDKWITDDGVTFANASSATTTFAMPAKDVTVTATYKETGGSTPSKGIFGTDAKWHGAWWHYILFFAGFGWIWMWF